MLRDKKRKHNNYIYEPKTLNLNENDVDMTPNINMWEAVRNTHDMNRSMLNVAYRKKDNYIDRSGFSTIMKVIAKNYFSDECFCSGSLAEGLALFRKNFDDWEFDIDIDLNKIEYILVHLLQNRA